MNIDYWYYSSNIDNLVLTDKHALVADNQNKHASVPPSTLALVFAHQGRPLFAQAVKIIKPSESTGEEVWGEEYKYVYDCSILSPIKSVNHIMTVTEFRTQAGGVPQNLREACFTYLL